MLVMLLPPRLSVEDIYDTFNLPRRHTLGRVRKYAGDNPVKVILHAILKGKRGSRPSMSYMEERNPRKALALALMDGCGLLDEHATIQSVAWCACDLVRDIRRPIRFVFRGISVDVLVGDTDKWVVTRWSKAMTLAQKHLTVIEAKVELAEAVV